MNKAEKIYRYTDGMEESKQVVKANSTTFYYAFSKLPDYRANSIFVLYHFLRQLDDFADHHKAAKFNAMVDVWYSIKANSPETQLGRNLWNVFDVFNLPFYDMNQMIAGQKADLYGAKIQDINDLNRYCYQVAGTVGQLIMPILTDYDVSKIYENINHIGIAMQITNIIRDVKEDALSGRVYLPTKLMEVFHVKKEDLLKEHTDKNLKALLKYLADYANDLYKDKKVVLNFIDNRNAKVSISLAIDGYHKILTNIEKRDYDVLDSRVYVNKASKLMLYLKNSIFQ
ncbi:phytoene/squalene synthase family protein [Apilactobacillus xinyiensis]|uniref:Squalene/phytoene synthase family protein n=1 Tax=Apilactobacillus xinyiensis TaxID=2841032 RepID=A0ABT0I2B1_9LACO|nr:phytoene/squalene synthase family protein [Apilactobacillus xinyiensis]MCK8624870.1 squalene/phytoene synthase family protein [Apilactobacillus xinyiensis]